MSRSKTLYKIQEFDSSLDKSQKRIQEIDLALSDHRALEQACQIQETAGNILSEKQELLAQAEAAVAGQILKIDQNQAKLYGGAVTNPKELEDLQQEYHSLNKYLSILEERQLGAMLETEEAQAAYAHAAAEVERISKARQSLHADLLAEKEALSNSVEELTKEKDKYITENSRSDLPKYLELRKSLDGIAVTLMVSDSCASCGASIPSAIAQQVRSPGNLVSCPSCKRILHPG